MRNDKEIPFVRRIAQFIIADSGSAQAFRSLIMSTREPREVFDDALSAAKCKSQAEYHKSVAAAFAASKLVADQVYLIKQGSTPKYSKMNPTCNTDNPNNFKPTMHLKISVKMGRNQITSVNQIRPPK